MRRVSVRHAWLFLLLAVPGLASEVGRPVVQNFPSSVYERANQTWCALQDGRGVMYFGCFSVSLTFDGKTWGEVEMPFARTVRALAQTADGTIYAGAYNQLGRFRDAPGGRKEFESLIPVLPAEEREFGDVHAIAVEGPRVRFATTRRVFSWDGNRFSVLAHDAGRPFAVGPHLYFHRAGEPLRQLTANGVETVSSAGAIGAGALVFLSAGPDGTLLAGRADGALLQIRDGVVAPWPTSADEALRASGIAAGAWLPDGSCAVTLRSGGILFFDAQGGLITQLDESNGLHNGFVWSYFADRENGLWLCHGDGVSRLEWPPQISVFNQRSGLGRAGVVSLARHDGVLYASTHQGVRRLEPAQGGTPAQFVPVPGIEGSVPVLAGPDGLYAATGRALFQLRAGQFTPVLNFGPPTGATVRLVRSRRDPDRLWVLQAHGLRSVRRTAAGWIDEGLVPGIDRPLIGAEEEPDGTLWLTKQFDGFLRVALRYDDPAGPRVRQVEDFSGGRGLPARLAANNWVTLWRDRALFATDYGAYRFDAGRSAFIPMEELGPELNRPPLIISSLYGPAADRLWVTAYTTPPGKGVERGQRSYEIAADGQWRQLPLFVSIARGTPSRSAHLEETLADGRRVLWTAGANGLVRVELPGAFLKPVPFAVGIQAEAMESGHPWPSPRPRDVTDPRVPPEPPPAYEPRHLGEGERLAPTMSSLRFHFSAPRHQARAEPEYRTHLEGYDGEWSPWSAENARTFTELPAGTYRFRVEARDSDGRLASPAAFAFVVLPPWWRTWWAIALGLGAGGAGVAGLVRWRSRALERRNARLERLVAERTADLRQRETQLSVARDAAEAANRAKSTFLASMSHELRTPLNAVLGYAQLLRHHPGLPPDAGRQLTTIQQSGEHLLQVINEVLDLAKIEAGRVELNPAPASLPRFLAHLSEVFGLRANQKGLSFALRTTGALPETVRMDEARLRQVLYNLLGNAVKFTDTGGIELRAEDAGGLIRFSVVDTGVGIPLEERERIFERFHQAAGPRAEQGTGLGLAISQRLVRLMGGEIRVDSAPGRGSAFTFTLDLPPAEPPGAEEAPPRPVGY
jgi:signal transduction histidine kinase